MGRRAAVDDGRGERCDALDDPAVGGGGSGRAALGRIARAVAWLATALDGAVRAEAARGLDGEAAVAAMRATVAGTGRVATKLRAVMAETWRAMEGGR